MASNVKFLRGNQTNFNTLKTQKKITDGTFYLTEDTHKLYVGQQSGSNVEAILLNSSIIFVDSYDYLNNQTNGLAAQWKAAGTEALHVNEVYYVVPHTEVVNGKNVSAGNQLLVYTVENGNYKWAQINPDHNDNTEITDFAAVITQNVANKSALTTLSITDNRTANNTHDVQLGIVAGDAIKVVTDTLTVGGEDHPAIKITGDKYTMSADAASNKATISLASDLVAANNSSVVLEAGSNVKIEKVAATGNIKISSTDTNWVPDSPNSKFLYSTDAGVLSLTLTQSGTGGATYTFETDALGYKIHDGQTLYKFGEALPVYTIDEVDAKLKSLDGMTYAGTITSDGAADSDGTWKMVSLVPVHKDTSITDNAIHNGDMFLVTSKTGVVYDSQGHKAYNGDLLIATGTEGTNGSLSTIIWEYVPSANDIDTQYVLKNATETGGNSVINIYPAPNGVASANPVGTIGVSGSAADKIAVEYDATTNGNRYIATIKHTGSKVTPSAGSAITGQMKFTAVTGIGSDDFGHMTSITTQEFNVPQYSLSTEGNVEAEVDEDQNQTGKKVTLQQGLTVNSSTSYGSDIDITTDSLEVTSTGTGVNIDIKWGSF